MGAGADPASVDTEVAQVTRITDYLLGGDDNFAVDRKAIDYISAVLPGGLETARAITRASGGFLRRAATYLANEAGMRQFLTIGTPVPSENNLLHEMVQRWAPNAQVVYVIKDPVVLAHAHELRSGSSAGVVAFVHGDQLEPAKILRDAATTLDLTQPVAVLCLGRLHLVRDDDDAYRAVGQLVEAVPSGSYLTVTHMAGDVAADGLSEAAGRAADLARDTLMQTLVLRTHAQVSRFFDGLELVDPGIVPINRWRPREASADSDGRPDTAIYGGVARKP
jgi:hypothetical protein